VNLNPEIYPRILRPAFMCAGLAAYVLFAWQLLQGSLLHDGQLYGDDTLLVLLIGVWSAGFVALMLGREQVSHIVKIDEDTLVLCRALWCNLGAVCVAVLVPGALRLLLLIAPLFGLAYAAVHLARDKVVLVAVCTAVFYGMGVAYVASYSQVDVEFEVIIGLAFGGLLSGVLILAGEMQILRNELLERNRGLREAMERLQDMALKDDLTGLHNRRFVMEALARQKAMADRGQQNFTLCYADLDHFKLINDRFGHAVGDAALRQFAKLAESVVRNIDYVARFGGEEFLLVLVDADATTATRVARRLADHTRNMTVPGADLDFAITVSVGIASYHCGERVDDVISRADRALYDAKHAGRDRVMLAGVTV